MIACLTVDGLREEETIRSGSREQKKKMLPGGSGSGDLDDATEAFLSSPTILYPDPTVTTTAAATNRGSARKFSCLQFSDVPA